MKEEKKFKYRFYQTHSTWYVSDWNCLYEIKYCNGFISEEADDDFANNEEMAVVFEEYVSWSRHKRKKEKYKYMQYCNEISLGDYTPCALPSVSVPEPKVCSTAIYKKALLCAKKEENAMTAVDNTARDQRRYISERAYEVYYAKEFELKKAFGLTDTPQPETPKEFIQFIKEGKFILEEKYEDARLGYVWNVGSYIRFRDPKVKEDRKGYEAAKKLLDKDVQALRDDIAILDPKESLEKLRAFEAKSFQ